MTWSQMTSWVLVLIGALAIFVGLLSPGRTKVGRFSQRRFFAVTGAILLVAAGVLFIAVTIYLSSRAIPI